MQCLTLALTPDLESLLPRTENTWLAGQVYLVTELLLGGELLDAVLERGSYSEADARMCFAQLLSGIDYLHSR